MTAVAKLPEDDDGMPVGYADWYNNRFFGQPVNTARDHDCETAWRAGAMHALSSPAELGGVEAVAWYVGDDNAHFYIHKEDAETEAAKYGLPITSLYTTPRAAEADWLPIESAPKDGTLHIRGLHVFRPDGSLIGWQAFVGRMSDDGIDFIDADDQLIGWEPDDYTHWRPLPAPPALTPPSAKGE